MARDRVTRQVFPLCGTTASIFLLQYLRILETCSVVLGVSTTCELPLYLFIQQVLNPDKLSVCTSSGGIMSLKNVISSWLSWLYRGSRLCLDSVEKYREISLLYICARSRALHGAEFSKDKLCQTNA